MRAIPLALLLGCAGALSAAGGADAARGCGVVARQFTDGGARVTVVKGDLRCATAKRVLRTYWGRDVSAFDETRRVRVAGIRWTCRPTVEGFPKRWQCTGGGSEGARFRLTARE